MNWLKNILRYTWISAWYTFAMVVVLVATIFSSTRLMLPYASDYNSELSREISRQLGQPVSIGRLDAEWHGWDPSLILRDISLLDAETRQSIFKLGNIRIDLDVLTSLALQKPVFSSITLIGVDLLVTRDESGRISVAGVQGKQPGAQKNNDKANLNRLAGLIMSQGKIGLEDSGVTWHDRFGQDKLLRFSAVNLSLQNQGERHLLNASLVLPHEFGDSLRLHVDMVGDLLQLQGRQVSAFIEGKRVNVSKILGEQTRLKDFDAALNAADFTLWGEWEAGKLQQLQGEISSRDVALAPVPESGDSIDNIQFDQLAGKFFWQRKEDGWSLEADDVLLANAGRIPQPARLSMHYGENGSLGLKARLSSLELTDVTRLASLFAIKDERLADVLTNVSPQGKLHDAYLQIQTGDLFRYHLYTRLQGVTAKAWEKLPALVNADGQVWLSGEMARGTGAQKIKAQLKLQQAGMIIDMPEIFRGPIPVEKLQGHLAWQLEGKQWRLSGRQLTVENEDIGIKGTLDMVRDGEGRPLFVSLLAKFREGDGSKLSRYLPAGKMPPKALDWLDKGIVGGRVVSGGAVFNGRVDDFPFDDGSGRFEVAFKVEDGTLNYAKGWPQIKGIDADVQFLGRSMSIEASKGSIFSNRIQRAAVHIPNMKAKPLRVSVGGELTGATQDKLDYLTQSPQLLKAFGKHLKGMKAQGNSRLHLDLRLPIGLKNGAEVDGWIAMQDNSLSVDVLEQALTDVSGKLNFSHKSLQSDGIKATLLGQAIKLSISTEKTLQNRSIYIRGDGNFHAQDLTSIYLPVIKDNFSGEGQWSLSLAIPLNLKTKAADIPTLRVVTDLRGISVDLPAPLKKTSAEARNLSVQVDFLPEALPIMRVNYGDVLNGIFELGGKDKQQQRRGGFSLLAGPARLPDGPGFSLNASFDNFLLTDWLGLWDKGASPVQGSDGAVSLFNVVGLKANTFSAFNQQYRDFQLQAKPEKGGWRAIVDGPELQGSLYMPQDLSVFPINADLSYWYIGGLGDGKGELDPRDIPAMDISVRDFRYKERKFGSVKLRISKDADGIRIREAIIKPESTAISLNGAWKMSAAGQQSNISLNLLSKNVGNSLESLGYIGGINAGEGVVDVNLKWADSLLAVDAANIEGDMHINLKDGFLLDVDPGAGRLFGLLSLQMLPRRLLLDFSDVFKTGFGFDQIEGNFNVTGGNAYTNNFYMQGPSARVDITGRVGLVDEDYDQLATVTPEVSGALPVLGALALTPQIGAVILFAQKLLKADVERVTQVQYSITGKWKEPVITKLKKASGKSQSNADSPQ